MDWAKVVLAGGLLVLFVGFGVGTEPKSATVNGLSYPCGATIPAPWLVAGTESNTSGQKRPATAATRAVEAACRGVIGDTRLLMWAMLGTGALLTVAGWTPLRERARRVNGQPAPAFV